MLYLSALFIFSLSWFVVPDTTPAAIGTKNNMKYLCFVSIKTLYWRVEKGHFMA